MDANEAAKHLATIRHIMESAMRLTVLPGRAAIIGGLLALAGCGVTYWQMGSLDFAQINALAASLRHHLICVWAAVAVLGIAVDVLMTVLTARKHGQRAWPRLAQMATYAVGPGIVAGAVLTVALGMQQQWQMVPGVWMMLYGVAVWMASLMSVRAPSVLGLLFFVAGVLTILWLSPVALLMVGLTFGVAHIVYGIYLLARFGD